MACTPLAFNLFNRPVKSTFYHRSEEEFTTKQAGAVRRYQPDYRLGRHCCYRYFPTVYRPSPLCSVGSLFSVRYTGFSTYRDSLNNRITVEMGIIEYTRRCADDRFLADTLDMEW